MRSPQIIIDEIEFDNQAMIKAARGRVISKNRIADLDQLCYEQILIDLEIRKVA